MIRKRTVTQALSALTLIITGTTGTAVAGEASTNGNQATAMLSEATAIHALAGLDLEEFGAPQDKLKASAASTPHHDDDSFGQHHHHDMGQTPPVAQMGEFNV
ncbi:hypothetical protein [Dyella flagellata]|uniref:Secreted protein n=1 Tax=Dyella flagellata TaxID=1867833 RepID=A0ABQ5XC07_9GAMM|nr:hypothetical protein [Dyella flagellata]GLQ89165.1 hypothetical protein GCM10007898_27370 [Dyella flagellata]